MKLKFTLGAALLALATACDSQVPDQRTRMELATVNGQALPAPVAGTPLEIVSGEIVIGPNDRIDENVVVRCRQDVQPGSCEVADGGRISRSGVYSQTEGWVRFDGTQYPAEFSGSRVVINYSVPPSHGVFMPPLVHEYTR